MRTIVRNLGAAIARQRLAAGLRALGLCLLGWLAGPVQAAAGVQLTLGGTPESLAYTRLVLEQTLASGGHAVEVRELTDLPMTRLELMLQRGDISALILGPTAERNRRFLPVWVDITDNLVNQRILFIPKGSQALYDPVHSLEDFRRLQRVAGMGTAWADRAIWESNGLPVVSIDGDWKRLYRMVASPARRIDYLPRGAHEMALEWKQHADLEVERNLVFTYAQDHILYVSPARPELHRLLQALLPQAQRTGLISRLAREYYHQAFEPPVSLQQRRVIRLGMPAIL
ncbi:hypothetical protein [Pseudomonas sp. AA-38]|uniref:hypothetical protein n=1 Tax=Pseudomonas sp. AA-38 TaxID=3028807 RepID=UPI0023F660D5|nr:hypothetical protein [Pseudomonas sp. AA-38]